MSQSNVLRCKAFNLIIGKKIKVTSLKLSSTQQHGITFQLSNQNLTGMPQTDDQLRATKLYR